MTDTKPSDVDEYPITARIWKREHTGEWVLELSGSINDTCFTSRHTEPLSVAPEDVPGLPSLYEAALRSIAQAFAAHRIAGEQAGRIAALEEAAGVAETHRYTEWLLDACTIRRDHRRDIAAAIRALKGPQA